MYLLVELGALKRQRAGQALLGCVQLTVRLGAYKQHLGTLPWSAEHGCVSRTSAYIHSGSMRLYLQPHRLSQEKIECVVHTTSQQSFDALWCTAWSASRPSGAQNAPTFAELNTILTYTKSTLRQPVRLQTIAAAHVHHHTPSAVRRIACAAQVLQPAACSSLQGR